LIPFAQALPRRRVKQPSEIRSLEIRSLPNRFSCINLYAASSYLIFQVELAFGLSELKVKLNNAHVFPGGELPRALHLFF
jgi:hypothetical protein